MAYVRMYLLIAWMHSLYFLINSADKPYPYGYSTSNSYSSPNGNSYSAPYKPEISSYDYVFVPFTTPEPNPAASEYPYAGGIRKLPVSTVSPTVCKSTTFRTNIGCPCKLVNERCFPSNSVCKSISGTTGGICGCKDNYVAVNNTCVSATIYNQTIQPFTLLSPTILVSCFLPANSVIGNIPQVGANGSVTYTLTLLSSSPNPSTTKYISVESPSGNLLFLKTPDLSTVSSQTYSVVGKDASGITSNVVTFTVGYNCTAPTCSFDLGNSFTIDCTRFGVADTIVTALATGTVAPTTFALTLLSSTSTLGIRFYAIDPTTGQIFLQKEPHGGIFVEVYSLSATNAAGLTCTTKNITFTTAANCA
ncbi:uncharacterized protein LOC129591347 [Paramacrobiotus metropolitanus]|uniref:uncharacterized protein LOC129591347 n=1 Tax=Paramacrobiotus metropolitanus TaxID=2943436 RepID=UPI00244580B3|nr:uncharacterized protein LOC129591347 [Paramacrobiotus metropolitanus]